jgi:hypothetical protein
LIKRKIEGAVEKCLTILFTQKKLIEIKVDYLYLLGIWGAMKKINN